MFNFRQKIILFILSVTLVLLFFLDLSLGEIILNPLCLFTNKVETETAQQLILNFRLPKVLTAIIVGVSLSISGLLMQTLFRNPVAGPYILGISSGASLGVSIIIMGGSILSISSLNSNVSIVSGALIGSVGMLLLLAFILKYVRNIMTLLIIGVMLGALSTSLSSILQFFSPDFQVKSFIIWTFGNIANPNYGQILIMTIFCVVGLLLYIYSSKGLNIMLLGSQNLSNFGINQKHLEWLILLTTAILTGSITAFCGPIGFIGIIVPHFSKQLAQTSDHIKLLPFIGLTGSIIMIISDLISQLPDKGLILPINSVTAFIGIPFILWMLLKPNQKYISNE